MSFQTKQKTRCRPGFTLVELIVVVSILAIVGVLVIPSVRTLNEDRKVRDTARVVGSVFASARERAAVDGTAGVEIVSVPSNPGETPLRYNAPNMGLILYELRGIPAYLGDTAGATVTFTRVDPDGVLGPDPEEWQGTFPAGTDIILAGIKANDYIELNGNGIRIRIVEVVLVPNPPGDNDPTDDYIVLDFPTGLQTAPYPPLRETGSSFKIHRQPVRVESSAIRLPNNLFLNLAWSGHGNETSLDPFGVEVGPHNTENQFKGRQFRDFSSAPAGHPDPLNYPVMDPSRPAGTPDGSTRIMFSSGGGISLVTTRSYIPNPGGIPPFIYDYSYMEPPAGPVHFLMCSANNDNVDLTNLDSTDFLQDDNNMWITINHRTGSVSTGKMANVVSPAAHENIRLKETRLLARKRRSANP